MLQPRHQLVPVDDGSVLANLLLVLLVDLETKQRTVGTEKKRERLLVARVRKQADYSVSLPESRVRRRRSCRLRLELEFFTTGYADNVASSPY